MRIAPDNIAYIDTALAGFIVSLAGSRPDCRGLLLVDGEILSELTAKPSSNLISAWEKLVREKFVQRPQSLVEKPLRLQVTPALIGLAVIVHNRIYLSDERSSDAREAADLHDLTLLNLLPVPETDSDILGFDLLISAYGNFLRETGVTLGPENLRIGLLHFSPFTALKSLDLALPSPLASRASEYLPNWQAAVLSDDSLFESDAWWGRVRDLLGRPELAFRLGTGWLEMPENRLSCIGLGIFFEELRQQGNYDDHILRFFEAYEFLHKVVTTEVNSGTKATGFALLTLIETMLAAAGDGNSSRHLNQTGNEYFLKFRALLEIVANSGGVPGGFRHLSHDFCFKRLLPLVSLATITGGQRREPGALVDFGRINFS